MSNHLKILLLAACILAFPGCRGLWTALGITAAAGVGAAAVYYAMGDLETDFDDDLDDLYSATVDALEERGYTIDATETELRTDEADVEATIPAVGDEDERDVSVHLERDGAKTSMSIRVGLVGDEKLSRAILDSIEAELPAEAVAATE